MGKKLGVVAVVGAIGVGSSVHAQSIGYVETLGGSLSSAVDYNSAGGANSVSITGTGLFQVTLGALGSGLNSDVQVNAVNTDGRGHYCTSDGWGSTGTNVIANVACFDLSGNPLSADFSLIYQARTTAPATGAIAFLWANNATAARYTPDASYSFNSGGAINKVHRHATGLYSAYLPTMPSNGNPQVTAYGGGAARCEVVQWGHYPLGAKVDVQCVNAAGAAADAPFDLSYTAGTTQAAGPAATPHGAYAFANDATKKNYVPTPKLQLNAITPGALTAQRFGKLPGQYTLTMPNPNNQRFSTILGMITAVGSAGEYCDQQGVFVPSDSVYMGVICYSPDGRQVDTTYSGTLITTP